MSVTRFREIFRKLADFSTPYSLDTLLKELDELTFSPATVRYVARRLNNQQANMLKERLEQIEEMGHSLGQNTHKIEVLLKNIDPQGAPDAEEKEVQKQELAELEEKEKMSEEQEKKVQEEEKEKIIKEIEEDYQRILERAADQSRLESESEESEEESEEESSYEKKLNDFTEIFEGKETLQTIYAKKINEFLEQNEKRKLEREGRKLNEHSVEEEKKINEEVKVQEKPADDVKPQDPRKREELRSREMPAKDKEEEEDVYTYESHKSEVPIFELEIEEPRARVILQPVEASEITAQ